MGRSGRIDKCPIRHRDGVTPVIDALDAERMSWWKCLSPCRRRARVLRAAEAEQEAERRAAKQRILEANAWNDPTQALDTRPFMTPGQEHRSRRKPRNERS